MKRGLQLLISPFSMRKAPVHLNPIEDSEDLVSDPALR